MTDKKKVWTRAEIEEKITKDQAWLERAILALYEYQTLDERKAEISVEENNVGFNKPDAGRLSYYAKWIMNGKHLSGPHIEIARNKIQKYCGQLTKIANNKVN